MSKVLFYRVASDLRLNLPIIICDGEEEYIIFRADTLSEPQFNTIRECKPKFVISKYKVNFFLKTDYQVDLYIDINENFSYLEFVDNLINFNIDKSELERCFEKDNDTLNTNLLTALLKLFFYSEILPLGLILNLKNCPQEMYDFFDIDHIRDISRVNAHDILHFDSVVYDNIIRRQSCEIFLFNCVKTELIIYESGWKQHSVIIFNGSKNLDTSDVYCDDKDINININKIPVVRIHSSCYTGDLFGSLSCDCNSQLRGAISFMKDYDGVGILIYLNQEGRGIGLINKLKTYIAQNDNNLDTIDANLSIGFKSECRDFKIVADILKDMNIYNVNVLTNNIEKIKSLELNGIKVSDRIDTESIVSVHNLKYLSVKASRLGHCIRFV